MAKLTDTLQTEQRGMETQAPVGPAPSFLETLAGFGSSALQAQKSADNTLQQRDAQARAKVKFSQDQIEFQQKQQDRAANNAAAGSVPNIYYGVDSGQQDQDLSFAARDAAGTITNHQTAAEQGTITPQMAEVRTEATIRSLLRKFPGSEAAIMSTLKEHGVTSIMTREYDKAAKALDAEDDAHAKREQDIKNFGLTELGMDVDNLPVEKQAEGRRAILSAMAAKSLLEQQSKQADIQSKQYAITKDQRDYLEKDNSTNTAQAVGNQITALMFPTTQRITELLADPSMDDATKDKQISAAMAVIKSQGQLVYNNLLTQYGARLNEGDRSYVKNIFDGYMNSLTDMMTGPTSIVQTNKRNLDILQTKLGVDIHQAMPMWTEMNKLIGPSALGALLGTDLLGNPEVRNALKSEFNGFSTLKPNEAKVRVNNVLSILQGATNVHDYSSQEARKMAPALMGTMNSLVQNHSAVTGKDEQAHLSAINAIGAVANVGIEANVQWGSNALSNYALLMTDSKVVQTLAGSHANEERRSLAVNAYLPSVKATYNALRASKSEDPYYKTQWNAGKSAWEVVRTNVPFPVKSNGGTGFMRGEMNSSVDSRGPSEAIQKKARALNQTVNTLTLMGTKGQDGSLPKGVSEKQAREWYANDVPPPQMVKEQAAERKSQRQNISDIISNSLKQVGELKPAQGPVIAPPMSVEEVKAKFGKTTVGKINIPRVEAAAQKWGVPVEVALRLAGRESGFDPSKFGPQTKYGRAFGIGQVLPTTAKKYGVDDVTKLDPDQQADLMMHILHDNHKAHGTWEDAVSAYHSGVNLQTAANQGRSDGLMKTVDYVSSIVG